MLHNESVVVAREILGWRLYVREKDNSLTGGVIIETEAYKEDDAASHSFGGKSLRNEAMFMAAGHIYVYFIYGKHWCMNIVTGAVNDGQAVLIRAIRPTDNLQLIRKRRHNIADKELTNGPAKVCQALGVTGADNSRMIGGNRFVLMPPDKAPNKISASPRIGISKGKEELWRFVLVE